MAEKQIVESLTREEALYAMKCVEQWLWIKEVEQQPTNSPDATHSSLLLWLLTGNKPLPKPPPTIMSRPHHGLASGEPVKLNGPPIPIGSEGNKVWRWIDHNNCLLAHVSGQVFSWDTETKTLQLYRRPQQ